MDWLHELDRMAQDLPWWGSLSIEVRRAIVHALRLSGFGVDEAFIVLQAVDEDTESIVCTHHGDNVRWTLAPVSRN
jgi:hypothetical protein